jgi:hypothetical protein
MKYLNTLALSLLFVILGGCMTDESSPKDSVQPEIINVVISLNEEFDEDNHLKLYGKTNLPDDMELMLMVTSKEGYDSEAKVYVNNGMFESEWFSDNGKGLPVGKFTALLTSPTANIQPLSVKGIIGELGGNLSGAHVIDDVVFGKRVEFLYTFNSEIAMIDLTSEDEGIWNIVNEYLETGQYSKAAIFIDRIPNPNEDLQMNYDYSMYHVYGQNDEEDKSLEALYKIPSSYNGHNADLISYFKYIHESYESGRREAPLSFDDYADNYTIGKLNSNSFYYYKSIQDQDNSLVENPKKSSSENIKSVESSSFLDQRDYNIYGEYKPVENMTQEEIQAELEVILERSLSGK